MKTKNPLEINSKADTKSKTIARMEIEDTESCPVCHVQMELISADGVLCKTCITDRIALPVENSKI